MRRFCFVIGQELTDEEVKRCPSLDFFTVRPGLGDPLHCRRCGSTSAFAFHPCARCGTECAYCRSCIMMGKISACTSLYRWAGEVPAHPAGAGTLHWAGELSSGQRAASERVVQAIQEKAGHTVWAVTGAGKTEVLFAGIAFALAAEMRVCVAVPRADVVRELAPRLLHVFPDTPPAVLYGGSPDRHTYSPLVVSTTHQLLRYKEAFDVMIVDEVDAFPYTFDPSLQFAVQKARKPVSSLIYLTATPDPAWQAEIEAGRRSATLIPARYHRQPLPVPAMQWCGNWKRTLAPEPVRQWAASRTKAIIFYPYINTMERALPLFQAINPRIESVHAADPLRREKVEAMRSGTIPMLLSTTILERGVTFPGVEVAVVGAEDPVFTESALVQMAGRAGRSARCPGGDVVFFHYGKTNAMIRAIRHIQSMNALGLERGLLDR